MRRTFIKLPFGWGRKSGAGEGARTLDPDLGKVVPNACVGLQQIDPAYKAYLNQYLTVC
jgi:hypothetical protein